MDSPLFPFVLILFFVLFGVVLIGGLIVAAIISRKREQKRFNDALLGFYEMNQGTSTDGGGNQLFIFRQNSRVEPHETQAFLNWAMGLKNLFVQNW